MNYICSIRLVRHQERTKTRVEFTQDVQHCLLVVIHVHVVVYPPTLSNQHEWSMCLGIFSSMEVGVSPSNTPAECSAELMQLWNDLFGTYSFNVPRISNSSNDCEGGYRRIRLAMFLTTKKTGGWLHASGIRLKSWLTEQHSKTLTEFQCPVEEQTAQTPKIKTIRRNIPFYVVPTRIKLVSSVVIVIEADNKAGTRFYFGLLFHLFKLFSFNLWPPPSQTRIRFLTSDR